MILIMQINHITGLTNLLSQCAYLRFIEWIFPVYLSATGLSTARIEEEQQ